MRWLKSKTRPYTAILQKLAQATPSPYTAAPSTTNLHPKELVGMYRVMMREAQAWTQVTRSCTCKPEARLGLQGTLQLRAWSGTRPPRPSSARFLSSTLVAGTQQTNAAKHALYHREGVAKPDAYTLPRSHVARTFSEQGLLMYPRRVVFAHLRLIPIVLFVVPFGLAGQSVAYSEMLLPPLSIALEPTSESSGREKATKSGSSPPQATKLNTARTPPMSPTKSTLPKGPTCYRNGQGSDQHEGTNIKQSWLWMLENHHHHLSCDVPGTGKPRTS